MHHFLTLKGEHLRPPAVAASDSGSVELDRADYTQVSASVPLNIGAKSGFLRQGEYGATAPSNHIGFADTKLDVRPRDVFIVSNEAYEVQFVGNRGTYLVAFDLAKKVIR